MASDGLPVWARPERRTGRATGSALSREQIVGAASRIADADGIDAVSMRRIAAELGAGTMSLYRHVATKDDLFDLMLDAAIGEPFGKKTGEWLAFKRADTLRGNLLMMGHGLRTIVHRHPWVSQVMAGRPSFGPNMVRSIDAALSFFDDLNLDADTMMNAIGAINAFVFGFVQEELAEKEMQRRTGLSEQEWRARMAPYIRSLLETGQYPRLRKVIVEGSDPEDHGVEFDAQLALVVGGIIGSLPARARRA
ncbi:MAG TPA: TetR/AcrR family transcriptional regulator [Mycobacteriales bacterium]|jgi:AcrR family transcriptional regulator|nr:TetR/AcrR family transcriptional regulator [Mycobacteriales bacterium]